VFAANRAELSLYAVTIGLLVWLWQSGRGRFEVVVSAGIPDLGFERQAAIGAKSVPA